MLLTLSIKNHQGKRPHSTEEYNFGHEGGSIGRDNNNEWVLPDQNNFLSKKHASIEFNHGDFFITDTSTNGVFINYSRTPLGRGNQHKISSSDRITMGEYTLRVSQLDQSVNIDSDTPPPQEKRRFTLKTNQDRYTSDVDPFDEIFTQTTKEETSLPETPHIVDSAETKEEALLKKPQTEKMTEAKKATPLKKLQTEKVTEAKKATPLKEPKIEKIPEIKKEASLKEPQIEDDIKTPKITTAPKEEIIKPETEPKPIETAKKKTKETSKEQSTSEDSEALTHILLSAGLSIEDIRQIQPNEETYQTIGQALKESLDGTMNLLRSRSAAKNHLHLEHTLICQRKNNPLKFSQNAPAVLKQTLLLDKADDTYLTLTDALREAYNDISAHEYSMATSIQEALAITIKKHFSPIGLQKKLEKR